MAESNQQARAWTDEEVRQLKELAGHNTPTGLIAHKLGRSEAAVQSKASDEGISLAPPNRPPYGRVE